MAKLGSSDAFTIQTLAARYRSGELDPIQVAEECLRRIEAHGDPAVWITRFNRDEVIQQARAAHARIAAGELQPLLGIPFAIKDNIDVAGHPTTAACPAFAHLPARTATAVDRLCDAGAVLVGKTNLDQFATGLVGTRSPYGTPRNPFDPSYIPGGSSSGSAVAVSTGLVAFALGTDTAGSGRVPAAFNNIVGLKPTRGRISAAGVVPACQSLDCVSVFALTCSDAAAVMDVAAGYDPQDIYSRETATLPSAPALPERFRFGIPADDRLKFFSDSGAEALYKESVGRLEALGGTAVVIDFAPFADAGMLLYDGPWVAERVSGLREFVANDADSVLPITRGILHSSRRFDAVAAFDGLHELRAFQHLTAPEWAKMDLLFLPTAGTIYTLAEVEADPLRRNANLGYYTTFMNLLDLCGVAVPGGLLGNGLPWGVTLVGQAGQEQTLLDLGDRLHRSGKIGLGAAQYSFPPPAPIGTPAAPLIKLAVVGAHLSDQPLNHQLTNLDAHLLQTCKTASCYKLFALANVQPPKPGLQRTSDQSGAAIEVEVWEMTAEAFGKFVASVPPPMVIGTVRLEDNQEVKSFLCEPYAIAGARDITHLGGWRNFLRSQ
ncbi:MAG TPA: allophanate hydrolase [Tepidisphaeraceae bacterium]|jgi:allophanate hydrolase|nr:allophanate hydrolase [Tepidisphaeraceae bacterium]